MNSNAQSRKVAFVLKQNDKFKSDITMLKQGQSTQRIQYEQVNNDLKNRLNARESTIQDLNTKLAEKDRMLEQFRRLHSGGDIHDNNAIENKENNGSSRQNYHHHHIPPSTSVGNRHHNDNGSVSVGDGGVIDRHRHNNNPYSSGNSVASTALEPPLKGLMMQRQANHVAQQQAFASKRGPSIPPSSSGMHRSNHYQQQQHTMGPPTAPGYSRPYSSSNSVSSNSLSSNAPRVRDLAHNTTFNFTSGSGSSIGGGQPRLNKRRRSDQAVTPASVAMSPNTAFTLNQGAQTARGPRWLRGDGRNY